MPEPAEGLCVTLPQSLASSEYAVLCQQLAAALGLQVQLRPDAGEHGRVLFSRGECGLEMRIHSASPNLNKFGVHEISCCERAVRVLTEDKPQLIGEGRRWRVEGDILTPLIGLMTLQEEHLDLHRDRFGLVEGNRSIRQRLGALSEPFFGNALELLRQIFGLSRPAIYPGGATWAVAVSSDIDVLEEDHLGGVLSFLESHGVDRPTFMICPATGSEKTVRDPGYDITERTSRTHLAPLLEADVEIALHGSYLAHDRLDMLVAQKQRLEEWCGRPVHGHRAHFYRFAYPRSWMRQREAGLSYDSSLGYPDLPGLRMGCASPTLFFDPDHQPTEFAIFPTAILDQHFFWPQPWDDDRFVRYASDLLDRAASLGSALNLDWHTYTWTAAYPGWWERLSWLLREARLRGAYIGGIGAVLNPHWRRWRELAILTKSIRPSAASSTPGPRYYDQPALWGKAPDPYQVQVQADILELLPPDVQSVLDLGCGDGYIANSMPSRVRVVGMDISAEALRYLRHPGLVGSGEFLPFADGALDLVMANDVLEHLETPQRERVLAEMCRVAKRYVLYTSPHDEQLSANLAKCADCGAIYHIHWHHHAFRGEELPRRLAPDFDLLEVRYSGDVTLPPADPLVPLRHELGMFRTWKDAVCSQCGSNRQMGRATDSFLARMLAARRCELWYADLHALARSSNRSEIMALYGKTHPDRRESKRPPTRQGDLREVDFANPLQTVAEFTPGSAWASYRLTVGMNQSTAGVSRKPNAPVHSAIEVRLPVTARNSDRIILEATSDKSPGTITVFALDGVLAKQLQIGAFTVQGQSNRCELVVHDPWRSDAFGAGLRLELSDSVVLHRLTYLPADRSNATADFVELAEGHNTLIATDQGVRVSWGLTVDSAGRVPLPPLALQARPPLPNLDPRPLANELLRISEDVLADLASDHERVSRLAEDRERLRDAAERAHARLEARCVHLERRQRRLKDLGDYYWQELQRRRGIKGGAKEIVRTARDRVRGPVTRPRRLRLSPPWAKVPQRLVTPPGALRVLVLSHMFPHPDQPSSGTFVHEQVKALRVEGGVDARVLAGRPFWMSTRHPLRLWQGNANWRRHHDESPWYLYDGIPVQYLPYRIFGPWFTHGWSYARTMLRSIDQLHREFPFDIIHAHTGYLDGSAGREIARRFDIPLIVTEHTGPFSMLMKNPIIRRRTLRSLSAASRVIAVSRAQQGAIEQYWTRRRGDQMEVVPNLVDTLQFHPPQAWSPDSQAPRFLFVGGFVPIKALPILLDAFVKVRERLPQAALTLMGGGENQAQEDLLQSDIARRGLTGVVRVLGHQGRSEVARLMRDECDILVLPSQSETFGCVLIEALASGKPVVATRCGGPEDIVGDESVGRLCPPNDPGALAEALLDVASRLATLDSAQIRQYAVQRFSQSATARRIVDIYKSVLRGQPPTGHP